jgi:surface polysaccharide O-acyltransferase-like enzyme
VFWIDALRVAAAAAVVFLHVAAEPVVFVKDRSAAAWWVGNAIDAATRWCVPIFVMLSGALLLGRQGESTRRFFARRVRRIAVPLVAWSAIYIAYQAWRRGLPDASWILERLLYGRPEYHLWYVYMTLGLYLLTPALRRLVARVEPDRVRALWIGWMLACALHDALYSFAAAPMFRSVFTLYLPFLGYYLAGHDLLERPPRSRSAPLALVIVAGIAISAGGTRWLMDRHGVSPAGLYLYEYLSPAVIATSLALFVLARRMPEPRPGAALRRWMRDASLASLGIYLIHVLVISLLRQAGWAAVPLGVAGVPLVAGAALLLSYACVSLLRRVPLLRQCV